MISLVLGVNGQDGSYLCQALLDAGTNVVGIGRDPASRHVPNQPGYRYIQLDLGDTDALKAIASDIQPDVCYHVAAVHGATAEGFTYEAVFDAMIRVNVLALQAILEVARTVRPDMRVLYASSSKIFPPPLTGRIDESTAARATCLYSIGKIAARDLLAQYRSRHGIRGTNMILFNHDSPRRSAEFFIPTIARAIRLARTDPRASVTVRTLDFWIDLGSAKEYMAIVSELWRSPDLSELIVASGRTSYGRDLVRASFERHGLQMSDHLVEEQTDVGAPPRFEVCVDRLTEAVRSPCVTADAILDEIVAAGHVTT